MWKEDEMMMQFLNRDLKNDKRDKKRHQKRFVRDNGFGIEETYKMVHPPMHYTEEEIMK